MTTVGYSGPSIPASYLPAVAPVITSFSTSTAAEVSLVFGTYPSGATLEVYEDGAWGAMDSDCLMLGNAFVYPAILETGANVVRFRSLDRFGAYSSTASCTITRADRLLHRATKTTVTLNGSDVTSYVHDVKTEMAEKDGLIRLAATFAGYSSIVTTADTLAVTVNDGAVSTTRSARVLSVTRTFDNGSRVQSVIAQGEADKLPRLTLSTSFAGKTNGAVIKEVLEAAGYTTIHIPRGNRYTGPRSVEKAKAYDDIVLPVLFAEDWLLWPLSSTSMVVLPSYFNRFVWWTFSDDHIVRLSETEERGFLINKARAVYQAAEPDLNINYELGEQLPDKIAATVEGYEWFDDDSYARPVETYPADGVLFFACWGPSIDWERVSRSVLKIKFANTPNEIGGTKFSYNVDLEIFSSKKIAVGYFDLRKYHLPAGTVLYYAFNVQDRDGKFIGNGNNWRTLTLTGTETANFQALITQFGVQLGAPEKVATFSASWTPTVADDGPTDGVQGVIFSRYDQNNDQVDYTFYIEVDVGDISIQTVTFDLDQATANTARPVHLVNCEIVTDDNSEFNGNPWIYGVISHKPNAPIRRADKLIFKCKSRITLGQKISIAFNVWARKFIAAAGYEDFEEINVTHSNAKSVAEYGEIDGGCLVSAFWSSKTQARRRLRKFVDARAVPTKREELLVPGSSEIRAGQLLRVFSLANGGAYNHYYRVIEASPDKDMTRINAIRGISVAVDDSIVEPVAPDVATDLADTIEALAPALKTLQFGTVAANKYRGMFRVDFESGVSVQHVISRVDGVKSRDKVACVQSGDGTWMIVEIVTPSTSNVDLEEELKPEDDLEDTDEERIIDPSIPGYDDLVGGLVDRNNRQSINRPMPNIITVKSIKTIPTDDEGEIPYRGIVFVVELSHDVKCYASKTGKNADNITNFVYLAQGTNGNSETLYGRRVSSATYEFRPAGVLLFGKKMRFGIKTINGSHPAHYGYNGPEVKLVLGSVAQLASGAHTYRDFTVEPEFKIVSVDVHGPCERQVTFQGKPNEDDASDGTKYFMIPDSEE